MIPSIPTAVCSNSGNPSDKKQKFFFFLKGGRGGGGRIQVRARNAAHPTPLQAIIKVL